MNIREMMNQHRNIALSILCIVILWAGIVIVRQVFFAPPSITAPGSRYYSDDDGITWFIDDERKLPPFDHNGRTAVIAHVYSCDNGKTLFIGYLESFDKNARDKWQKVVDAGPGVPIPPDAAPPDPLVKLPGEGVWQSPDAFLLTGRHFIPTTCPDGKPATNLQESFPK